MTTRQKNIVGFIFAALLSILLGITCNAQPGGGVTFTRPPAHPELQEESCDCLTKVAKFSCYPDCEFTKVESMLSNTGVPLTRITALFPFSIDVKFTFADGVYTFEGLNRVVFNGDACQIVYEDGRFGMVRNFKEILLIKRND